VQGPRRHIAPCAPCSAAVPVRRHLSRTYPWKAEARISHSVGILFTEQHLLVVACLTPSLPVSTVLSFN
jgi:hypothetical protein